MVRGIDFVILDTFRRFTVIFELFIWFFVLPLSYFLNLSGKNSGQIRGMGLYQGDGKGQTLVQN